MFAAKFVTGGGGLLIGAQRAGETPFLTPPLLKPLALFEAPGPFEDRQHLEIKGISKN